MVGEAGDCVVSGALWGAAVGGRGDAEGGGIAGAALGEDREPRLMVRVPDRTSSLMPSCASIRSIAPSLSPAPVASG
jgi:hypothetical protein